MVTQYRLLIIAAARRARPTAAPRRRRGTPGGASARPLEIARAFEAATARRSRAGAPRAEPRASPAAGTGFAGALEAAGGLEIAGPLEVAAGAFFSTGRFAGPPGGIFASRAGCARFSGEATWLSTEATWLAGEAAAAGRSTLLGVGTVAERLAFAEASGLVAAQVAVLAGLDELWLGEPVEPEASGWGPGALRRSAAESAFAFGRAAPGGAAFALLESVRGLAGKASRLAVAGFAVTGLRSKLPSGLRV